MSSYDCVLPIEEPTLRRIAERRSTVSECPVLSSSLRPLGEAPHDDIVRLVRGAAAIVEPVWGGTYGKLHDRPEVAVAGTKNGFVLDGLDKIWVRELSLYRCVWREAVPGVVLLDALLHGIRGLPGSAVLAEAPAWPAHDVPMVLGYLLPAEVRELDAEAGPLGANPHAAALRAMITRAAGRGLSLVTLQGAL